MDFGSFYMHAGHMYKKLGQSTIELEYAWKIWFNLIKNKIRFIYIYTYKDVLYRQIYFKKCIVQKTFKFF